MSDPSGTWAFAVGHGIFEAVDPGRRGQHRAETEQSFAVGAWMMQQGPLEDLRTFGALAQEIAGQADPAAAAARVVELAVKTVGCDWAGIGQIRAGRLTFLAGTDADLSKEITRIAYDTGESITMQACQSGTAVLCNDLAHDRLWPRASPLGVARTPARAVLAFPLHLQEQELGVLTCYSGTVGFFGQE